MPIEKPLPLMVGDKAYYSLTSYDPVQISVEVLAVTDEDVAIALEATVQALGGTMASLDDPAWVAQRFDGLTSRAQVTEVVRQQVAAMNQQMAEEQKLSACVEALAARLCQSIPPQILERTRESVRQSFVQSLQAEGMTPEQFMARTGTSPAQLEAMFAQQAQQTAEGDAALSAYAHQKKIKVTDEELPQILGMPAEDAQAILAQARAAGQMDGLREMGVLAKAALAVVAECSCSYEHESPERARARAAQYRHMRKALDEQKPPEEPPAPEHRTGFKLV